MSVLVTQCLAVAFLVLVYAASGYAQDPLPWQTKADSPATLASGLAVSPLVAPVVLQLKAGGAFGLHAELIDRGGASRGPTTVRVAGQGSLQRARSGDGGLALDLVITGIERDGVSLGDHGMFVRITSSLNSQGYATESRAAYRTPTQGQDPTQEMFVAHAVARTVALTLMPGLATLPEGPVQMGTPVFDVAPRLAMQATSIQAARLARAPEPGRVVGAVQYQGRLSVAATMDTSARFALGRGAAEFSVTGEQLIDVATGLPLYTTSRVVGSVTGASLAGNVDLVIRVAFTLPGMAEPRFDAPAVAPNPVAAPAPTVAPVPQSSPAVASEPAAVVAPPPAETNSPNDPEQRLRKLQELYERDLITEDEYRAKRAEILESL